MHDTQANLHNAVPCMLHVAHIARVVEHDHDPRGFCVAEHVPDVLYSIPVEKLHGRTDSDHLSGGEQIKTVPVHPRALPSAVLQYLFVSVCRLSHRGYHASRYYWVWTC